MLAQWRQTQQCCCDGNLFARKPSTSLDKGCLARRHARQDLDQRHPHQLGECHKNLANHLFSIDALHTLFYGWRSASLHCRLKRYQQPDSSLELIFTPFAPSPPQYSCKPLLLVIISSSSSFSLAVASSSSRLPSPHSFSAAWAKKSCLEIRIKKKTETANLLNGRLEWTIKANDNADTQDNLNSLWWHQCSWYVASMLMFTSSSSSSRRTVQPWSFACRHWW